MKFVQGGSFSWKEKGNGMFEHEVLTESNVTFKYFGEASSLKQDQNQQTKPEY